MDQDRELVPSLVLAVRGLLRVDPSDRLSAAEAAVLLEAVDVEIEEARVVEEEARIAAQLQVGQPAVSCWFPTFHDLSISTAHNSRQ